MPFSPRDDAFMRAALVLARRGLGRVWPNPAVGCVIVGDGRVVGRGWTRPGGRPHAETVALEQAGEAARGATAYVTLEPCSHHGKTPPCAEALVQAGVARVVTAMQDPDPRVSGEGHARLSDAGISVETGLCAKEAEAVNAGFLTGIREGRPLVTLKFATTLDGRIATHRGDSRWITDEAARACAHLLRAEADAILVGSGTVLADDPLLTCRLAGLEDRSPVRVVMDSRLAVPLTSALVRTAGEVPTWLYTLKDAPDERAAVLRDCGVEVVELAADRAGRPRLDALLADLGRRGITRLLVEGGARLSATFLRERLVDRIEWFRAPSVLGGDGLPAAEAFGVDELADLARFRRVDVRSVGVDLLESYVETS
ncbi:bifunctional diaminohydroxyphosphoribosylaminopyrimidine deaminase/5-amino-6-(5-phosphoribosylamino)uracil reductase RibD [Inquilinus sp. CAU 1745]|uniref:bifunctional diaminohydroxyphosphoribosylaminopyrimidine deaminase/5-amino-6-(5-phosphoribosylamino)uracil reductase RibD n=1 Tax=Inquilinus sp. CAU 1745 TaxID=3140369 RepID=UPI00325A8AA7